MMESIGVTFHHGKWAYRRRSNLRSHMSTETRVPGVSGGIHRGEGLSADAHVLGGVEELEHNRRALSLVEEHLQPLGRYPGRRPFGRLDPGDECVQALGPDVGEPDYAFEHGMSPLVDPRTSVQAPTRRLLGIRSTRSRRRGRLLNPRTARPAAPGRRRRRSTRRRCPTRRCPGSGRAWRAAPRRPRPGRSSRSRPAPRRARARSRRASRRRRRATRRSSAPSGR